MAALARLYRVDILVTEFYCIGFAFLVYKGI